MKHAHMLLMVGVAGLFLAAGCNETPSKAVAQSSSEKSVASRPAASMIKGKVVETMNTAGYTYVQVDTGSKKIWAAGPQCQVKVGDKVVIPPGQAMQNYQSKTLKRNFDTVYFVSAIMKEGQAMPSSAMPAGHPSMKKGSGISQVEVSGVKKAKGGKTVAEIFKGKQKLNGKSVTLRGKVVKFTPQIMGKNWLHIQDGTGSAGSNDLTVTTMATAKIGDTALVKGVIAVDKDFGYGYKYGVILEDAKITIE